MATYLGKKKPKLRHKVARTFLAFFAFLEQLSACAQFELPDVFKVIDRFTITCSIRTKNKQFDWLKACKDLIETRLSGILIKRG